MDEGKIPNALSGMYTVIICDGNFYGAERSIRLDYLNIDEVLSIIAIAKRQDECNDVIVRPYRDD